MTTTHTKQKATHNIRVTADVKERLRKLGTKGETFNDVVTKLLKLAESKAKD